MPLAAEREVIGRLRGIERPDELDAIEEGDDPELQDDGPVASGRAGRAEVGMARGVQRMRGGKTSDFATAESTGSRGSRWREGDPMGKTVSFAADPGFQEERSDDTRGTFNPRRSLNEEPRPYEYSHSEEPEEAERARRPFRERLAAWASGLRGRREEEDAFRGRSSMDHLRGTIAAHGLNALDVGGRFFQDGLAVAQKGLTQANQGMTALGAGIGLLEQDDDLDLAQEELEAEEKSRTWEIIMELKAIEYVGKDDEIDCFFAATIQPENPLARQDTVRLLPEFTPAYILAKGKRREDSRLCLENPYRMFERKKFRMSYKRLKSHILKIDMWKVSRISFNTYVGVGTRSVHQVATSEANMNIKLRQTLTQQDKDEMKKKKITSTPDIAVFEGCIVCEEVFDFQMACENWLLEMNPKHPDCQQWLSERKCLTFALPRDALSNASSRRRCRIVRTPWSPDTSKFFWGALRLKKVSFRGTRTSLQNSFFVVMVHSGNPVLESLPPFIHIGTALMGLTSVLDISVFRGRAKALANEEESFNVAVLTGSIRCTERSVGHKDQEVVPGGRPKQPKSERTVSHLSKKEMHLVVRVAKCEGLPVGDTEFGTSDPFLRVLWDNGVQTSQTIKGTLRPVFNFNTYFPVRFFNPRIMMPRHRETSLMFELATKGDITLQVWDDDGTSADYLGGTKVHMWQIMESKVIQKRSLLGQAAKIKETDPDADMGRAKVKQWFELDREVRVFDGTKTELVGCNLPKTEPAYIYFEAYFYPDDWPDEMEGLRHEEEGEHNDAHWRKKEEWFHAKASKFAQVYGAIYPDSIGAFPPASDTSTVSRTKLLRRFPSIGLHPQTLTAVPLMAFLAKIVAPEEYTRPAALLHWMNCITFFCTEAQEKSGRISEAGWKDPQTLLSARKGTVQDHAVLLCSVLLGNGSDAYVCKGTVWREEGSSATGQGSQEKTPKLVEHVWVMTRDEETGWVTFWEPCSREMYHLPHRCTKKEKQTYGKKPKRALSTFVGHLGGDQHGYGGLQRGESRQLGEDDYQSGLLASIGGTNRHATQPKAKAKMGSRAARKLREDNMVQERQTSDLAPDQKMLADMGGIHRPTLVDWLPYDSIDIVFNRENVWANHMNHHPACITYNMYETVVDDDTAGWLPLLSKEEQNTAEFKVDYIASEDVTLEPESQPERLAKLEGSLVAEMKENMRLFRQRKGMDTNWDRDPGHSIQSEVVKFLGILEMMRRLDVDFCPFADKAGLTEAESYIVERLGLGTEKYNVHGSPFRDSKGYETYPEEQEREWNFVVGRVQKFLDRKKSFPVKKGKVFRGLPIHFGTSDKDEIRNYLMEDAQYSEEILGVARDEGVLFSVHCKMFGLLGGVQSVWLYFGIQEPLEHRKEAPGAGAESAGEPKSRSLDAGATGGPLPDSGGGVLMDT